MSASIASELKNFSKNVFHAFPCKCTVSVSLWLTSKSPGKFPLDLNIFSKVLTARRSLSLSSLLFERKKFFQPQQCFEVTQLRYKHVCINVLFTVQYILQSLQIGTDYTSRLSLGFHSCNSKHQKTWLHCSVCVKNRKRLRNHPYIFLFQNLFDHTASHDTVRIKRSVCHSTGVDLVA